MRFREVDVTSAEALALLDEYFAERAAGFPAAQGAYRPTYPTAEQFTPPAGVFLVVEDDGESDRMRRRAPHPAAARDERGAVRGEAPVARAASPRSRRGATPPRRSSSVARSELGAQELVLDTNASLEAAGGALPLERLRRDRALQRQPERDALVRQARRLTSERATGDVRDRRSGSERVRLGHPGAHLERQVPEVVVRDEHQRLGRPTRMSTVSPQFAWLIASHRHVGRAERLAHEPADDEVVGDEQVVPVLAMRASATRPPHPPSAPAGLDLGRRSPSRRTARRRAAGRASGPTGCSPSAARDGSGSRAGIFAGHDRARSPARAAAARSRRR